MRPKTLSSDSPKSVGLKSHQLTQITISPLSQNFPGGADPKRKSLQAGATSQSASSIHFQVVAGQLLLHAGGLSSPRFLYGEIKLAKKVRGGCEENGCEGRSLGLPHRKTCESSSHPKRKCHSGISFVSPLAISQLSCRCKISFIIQCIMIATR